MKKILLMSAIVAAVLMGCEPEIPEPKPEILEPKPEIVMVRLTYDVNNAEFTSEVPTNTEVESGSALTTVELPTLTDSENYIFVGWYNGETKVETGYKITSDTLLVAKWSKPVNSLALNLGTIMLKQNQSSQLVALATPNDVTTKFTWSVEGSDAIRVDQNGLVTISENVSQESYGYVIATNQNKSVRCLVGVATQETFIFDVDNVYVVTGKGTVAVGTVRNGSVKVDDTIYILGGETPLESVATGIDKNKALVDEATVGDEVGILTRSISKEQIKSGYIISSYCFPPLE